MCKYCDSYVREIDNPDFEDFNKFDIELVSGHINLKLENYIGHKIDKPAIVLLASIEDDDGMNISDKWSETEIRYCPFCGVELESARKRFEETYKEENK